jgi:dihydrofolate reductase
MTHRTGLPVRPGADVRFAHGEVADIHADVVTAAGGKNVWLVGGGDLVGQYADADLLDDLLVSVAPVTLGGGRMLLPRRLDLELRAVHRNGAFACVEYTVAGH